MALSFAISKAAVCHATFADTQPELMIPDAQPGVKDCSLWLTGTPIPYSISFLSNA